jgi:choline dehydrogenase-like flavoprotein
VTHKADVCVIGSGAGGAVAAAELAEAGADVIVLEQGPEHDPDSFTARPAQMLARLYRDGGQTVTVGTPPIPLPLGRGVGGTTLINSGTCLRAPHPVLERWRARFGLDLDLDPHYDNIERALSVREVTPELAGHNAAVARRGAESLGWSHGYLRRNATGCVGSGVCAFGCPAAAKQHTGITYIPRARKAGARILTDTTARRIVVGRGRRATAVTATTGSDRTRIEIAAPIVVVAAGTVHTPLLLQRSKLGGDSGQLARKLSLHPATAVFAMMDEIVDMAHGVPQSFYIDEFAADGILFEGVAGPPSYVAMTLPLQGARHARAMAHYRQLAQMGLMVSDSSRGRVVKLAGRPIIRYDLNHADLERFRAGLHRLTELFRAAGAREIYLPLRDGARPENARPGDLKLAAFHPLGTARADGRPGQGVLDHHLAVNGARGVYVADGSAIPSSLGVNPQLTIMALARRLAHHLCRS